MTRLLIASRKGLFTARREGGHWQVDGHHFAGEPVTQVLADTRDGSWYAALRLGHFGVKLKKSVDHGLTWTEIACPAFPLKPVQGTWADDQTPWSVDLIWSLAQGGAGEPGVIWAGCMPAGLFRSVDGGASWQLVDSLWNDPRRKGWFGGGNDHPGMHSITVDPRDHHCVTVGISCGGVWRTADSGLSWTLLGQGLDAPYAPPELANDPNSQDVHSVVSCQSYPDIMWTQHHAGIYRSTDGGAHWSRLAAPLAPMTPKACDFGFVIVADPANPLRAWVAPALADTFRYAPDAAMCVARTDDAGATWQIFRNGLPQQHAYDLVYRHGMAVAADRQTLAMGSTTGGLWVSDNAAESWQTIDARLPPIAAVSWSAV